MKRQSGKEYLSKSIGLDKEKLRAYKLAELTAIFKESSISLYSDPTTKFRSKFGTALCSFYRYFQSVHTWLWSSNTIAQQLVVGTTCRKRVCGCGEVQGGAYHCTKIMNALFDLCYIKFAHNRPEKCAWKPKHRAPKVKKPHKNTLLSYFAGREKQNKRPRNEDNFSDQSNSEEEGEDEEVSDTNTTVVGVSIGLVALSGHNLNDMKNCKKKKHFSLTAHQLTNLFLNRIIIITLKLKQMTLIYHTLFQYASTAWANLRKKKQRRPGLLLRNKKLQPHLQLISQNPLQPKPQLPHHQLPQNQHKNSTQHPNPHHLQQNLLPQRKWSDSHSAVYITNRFCCSKLDWSVDVIY